MAVLDVEDALRLLILENTVVSGLIDDRFFTDVAEQDVCVPFVVMTRVSSVDQMRLSKRDGAVDARIQIECYSNLRSEARLVARSIKNSDITETKGTVHGIDIRGIAVEDGSREYPVYSNDGSDEHQYVTSFDLQVSYLEN